MGRGTPLGPRPRAPQAAVRVRLPAAPGGTRAGREGAGLPAAGWTEWAVEGLWTGLAGWSWPGAFGL